MDFLKEASEHLTRRLSTEDTGHPMRVDILASTVILLRVPGSPLSEARAKFMVGMDLGVDLLDRANKEDLKKAEELFLELAIAARRAHETL